MLRIISFLVLLLVSLASPFSVFAEKLLDCSNPVNAALATCKGAGLSIGGSLATVIQFLFVIAVILALGFLIYGGIRWITSGGDKAAVGTARGTIIAAIIGLIIVFLAYVIINLVLIFLTGNGIGGITIPNLTGDGNDNGNNSEEIRNELEEMTFCSGKNNIVSCNAARDRCHWADNSCLRNP